MPVGFAARVGIRSFSFVPVGPGSCPHLAELTPRSDIHLENNSFEEMASRVALLEREARARRRRANIAIGLALSCVFTSFLVIADGVRRQTPRTLVVSQLEAEDLRIRDRVSGSSISFGLNMDGRQSINFLDAKGVRQIGLAVTKDGLPVLNFFDRAGVARTSFGLTPEGDRVASVLDFRNARGEVRLSLGLSDGDLPRVVLKDRAGENRVGIMMTADDLARLQLSSLRAGKILGIRVQSSLDGEPAIDFLKGSGRTVRLPVKE